MADYPDYPQRIGSAPKALTGARFDRSVSGRLRGQSFYSGDMETFTVKHLLSNDELAALRSFYDANKLLPVQFTWVGDEQVYGVMFVKAPLSKPRVGGRNDVTVYLEEVE